ncbi:hypothetical protein B2K_34955 [Paenibacillus mucilaginosus K02]|uniref:Uncharacterized protein n=2 Tax=Paenibacillus mucilaginosus TaxID=61624 RepID=I0BTZ9_9BACL|nr:hypothetical protein KNP414_07370 [Paenibacillus mucilaginosus KNP414]AFH65846.1 hypothetical protein B2K_34955 [Paenibacillus mucilaginosus K02]
MGSFLRFMNDASAKHSSNVYISLFVLQYLLKNESKSLVFYKLPSLAWDVKIIHTI